MANANRRLYFIFLCFLIAPGFIFAEMPRLINYQGRLTDKRSTALSGKHAVTLRLYDAAEAGNLLWEESHQVTLAKEDNGLFTVVLGSTQPFHHDLSFNFPLWLSIEVDAGGELSLRQPLAAAPYALNAGKLDGMDSKQLIAAARLSPSPDLSVADLPLHARLHQPGGTDALVTAAAMAVAAANAQGKAASFSRSDHVHQGLHSVAVSGQPGIVGEATLVAGQNITLTQEGQTVTINAGGGMVTSSAHVSVKAADLKNIPGKKTTELFSEKITLNNPQASVLVLATVQLIYTAVPTNKTVEVSITRDTVVLETYTAEIGTAARAVSELPVTLHTLDTPGGGPHVYGVSATSSDSGVEAAERRLTLAEVP